MADIADVLDLLQFACELASYPLGSSNPSITGRDISVAQGWPNPDDLDTTIKGGNSVVSIYTEQSSTSPTDTPMRSFFTTAPASPGTVVSSDGSTVTFSGTPKVGDVVVVRAAGKVVTYPVTQGDGLGQVVAGVLAASAQISGLSSTASAITYPASDVVAAVSSTGTVAEKIHRQRVQAQINVWAPTPSDRTVISAAVDVELKSQVRRPMPDGTTALVS